MLARSPGSPGKAGDDSGFRADRIVELGGEGAEESEVAAREVLPLFHDEDAVGDGARRGRGDDQQQAGNAQARGGAIGDAHVVFRAENPRIYEESASNGSAGGRALVSI